MAGDIFGDIFGGLGGDALDAALRRARSKPQVKPNPQIRGRWIDDVFYVRAEDVADCLESQAPVPNMKLIVKLRNLTRR